MNKRNTIVYISGKYSGDINKNIKTARKYAIKIWESGRTVLTPHLNTYHFERDCKCTYKDYIKGDLVMLNRCDIIFMLPDWEESKGAIIERKFAMRNKIRIVYKIEDL